MKDRMIENFFAGRNGVDISYDVDSGLLRLQVDRLAASETIAFSNAFYLKPGAYRLLCAGGATCKKFGIGLMKNGGTKWYSLVSSWSDTHELLSEAFIVDEFGDCNIAVFVGTSDDLGEDCVTSEFQNMQIQFLAMSDLKAIQAAKLTSSLHIRDIISNVQDLHVRDLERQAEENLRQADDMRKNARLASLSNEYTIIPHENSLVEPFSRRLVTTFSNRPLDPERSHLHFLTKRWMTPGRLDNLPPFSSLPDINKGHRSKGGSLVVFDVEFDGKQIRFQPVYQVSSERKIQHGCFLNNNLVIAYEDGLEVFEQSAPGQWDQSVKLIDDPWFAGVHTVFPFKEQYLIVSASAPDGYVILDPETEEVKKRWRMPKAVYGENYKLTATSDLKRNFIHNDCQIGHLNYAYPDAKGNVYVSICAQGDVGRVNRWGFYSQLITGTTGLHGARDVPGRDVMYFSDSAKGMLVLANKKGQVQRRFDAKSIWLHDSVLLSWPWFLLAKSDKMEVDLVDVESMTTLHSFEVGRYGFVQFFS